MSKKLFVVSAVCQKEKEGTIGWRTRAVVALNLDEAIGMCVRLFSEEEPDGQFSAFGGMEIDPGVLGEDQ